MKSGFVCIDFFLLQISSMLRECHEFGMFSNYFSYAYSTSVCSVSQTIFWIFLGVVTSFLPNDLLNRAYMPTFSEQNCIPVVDVSQIEREILIALVFSPIEKKDVAKVAAKENSRAERWKQIGRTSKLYGFLFPRCSETSHLKIL